MRCVWCDSEYTFTGGEHFTIEEVMERVRDFACRLVEITGGEPLAQGEAGRNHWPNLERLRPELDEIKFVVTNRADWDFARQVIEDYCLENRAKAILISPAWGLIDLKELANWIAESGLNVRMQLQMHKYIWGPDVHGV